MVLRQNSLVRANEHVLDLLLVILLVQYNVRSDRARVFFVCIDDLAFFHFNAF